MINDIFILSQDRHYLSAQLARYCAWRAACGIIKEENIHILSLHDYILTKNNEQKTIIYNNNAVSWRGNDWLDFMLLRYLVAEKMSYKDNALILSPFAFANWDIRQLLNIDMADNAIIARPNYDDKNAITGYDPHVLLINCDRCNDWSFQNFLSMIFNHKIKFHDFIFLHHEKDKKIGTLEKNWNVLERSLNTKSGITTLHHEVIQPWRYGCDFSHDAINYCQFLIKKFQLQHNGKHPDPFMEGFIFARMREAIDANFIDIQDIKHASMNGLMRDDIAFCLGFDNL